MTRSSILWKVTRYLVSEAWGMSHSDGTLRATACDTSTPCPTVNLILCTYLNSGMAGPITMRFHVVKIWTLRFGIKYSSIGYMPIYGANNGATFEHWKKVIFAVSRKMCM